MIAVITLGLGFLYYAPDNPEDMRWQTMIFASLGFTQIGHALGLRASGRSPFSPAANPLLMAMAALTFLLQLAAVYIPFLETFFALQPLSWSELGLAVGAGLITLAAVLLESHLIRRSKHHS